MQFVFCYFFLQKSETDKNGTCEPVYGAKISRLGGIGRPFVDICSYSKRESEREGGGRSAPRQNTNEKEPAKRNGRSGYFAMARRERRPFSLSVSLGQK